jgi:transcriptional regulator with XRE-family HTH domain
MALFFDQDWFDEQLALLGRTKSDVADLLGLSATQVSEIWKDQRELLPHEVSALATFLGEAPADVADHAGVSTPVPTPPATGDLTAVLARLDEMSGRLERVERALVDLKTLVLEQRTDQSKER